MAENKSPIVDTDWVRVRLKDGSNALYWRILRGHRLLVIGSYRDWTLFVNGAWERAFNDSLQARWFAELWGRDDTAARARLTTGAVLRRRLAQALNAADVDEICEAMGLRGAVRC